MWSLKAGKLFLSHNPPSPKYSGGSNEHQKQADPGLTELMEKTRLTHGTICQQNGKPRDVIWAAAQEC